MWTMEPEEISMSDHDYTSSPYSDAWEEEFHRNLCILYKKPNIPAVVPPLPAAVEDKFKPYESLYELTLTTNKDEPYDLRASFLKIIQSKMFEIKGFIACIELTVQGLPHIHALLFSKKKYIDGSKIKTLYPLRYECKRVKLPGNYYEYINKEAKNQRVVDYCALKGIPQFWDELIPE